MLQGAAMGDAESQVLIGRMALEGAGDSRGFQGSPGDGNIRSQDIPWVKVCESIQSCVDIVDVIHPISKHGNLQQKRVQTVQNCRFISEFTT